MLYELFLKIHFVSTSHVSSGLEARTALWVVPVAGLGVSGGVCIYLSLWKLLRVDHPPDDGAPLALRYVGVVGEQDGVVWHHGVTGRQDASGGLAHALQDAVIHQEVVHQQLHIHTHTHSCEQETKHTLQQMQSY